MQVHLCFELGQELLEHKEGSENLCMGLMPTPHPGKHHCGRHKSHQVFPGSQTLIGGKENKKIIDEAHYTTQTHAWQRL